MMTNLFLFAFIAYGMSTIIVYGSILKPFRDFLNKYNPSFFGELVGCMLCTSTWVGFFLSLCMFSPTGDIYNMPLPFNIFFDGMFGAGIVWSINAIIEWFENNN